MKAFLEFHILQSFPPSLLNRDDTGAPKDCEFGGYRRGRISSQSLKRAIRRYLPASGLIGSENLAVRSKRMRGEIVRRLVSMGRDHVAAQGVAEALLGGLKLKLADDEKTQYLLFLAEKEIEKIAAIGHHHWEKIAAKRSEQTANPEAAEEKPAKRRTARQQKRELAEGVPAEVRSELQAALDGGQAADLALFGRMVADQAELSREAACQVAHAISVNAVSREFDYYTAVDDLKPEDTAGADMIGTVEFNSACFYRYSVIDLEKLRENLGGDRDLAVRTAEAFARASVEALPTGKQNTFAAHTPPGFVAVTARSTGVPRSLVNAFEEPVRAHGGRSLTAVAVSALETHWQQLDEAYGRVEEAACLLATANGLTYLERNRVRKSEEVFSFVRSGAQRLA